MRGVVRKQCQRSSCREHRTSTIHTEGRQTTPFHDSRPEQARFCRRGHPFDGWPLKIVSSRRRATGQLWLHVELPDGRRRCFPAAWTTL